MPVRSLLILLAAAAVVGCARGDRPATSAAADWRTVATGADRARLRGWRDAWLRGLADARAAGHGGEITAAGALFDPDRALPGALPPAGDYRCRVTKLGRKAAGSLPYVAYPWFACRIADEAGVKSFAKTSGSQRPVGLMFGDTPARAILLGTLVLGDETAPLDYGRDATRDMAGVVERIGERRWRLALPEPAFESLIDIVELVPTG